MGRSGTAYGKRFSMKHVLFVVAICLAAPSWSAAQTGFQDPLLDRLMGTWVLRGTIAGAECTHDIASEWILGHQYLRIEEVARETESNGKPAYEAMVLVGWDEPTGRYACLWLDDTGGGGLSNGIIGYAGPGEDELAFVFETGAESAIHTTFAYRRENDTWQWLIDLENGEKRKSFARVTLTRE